MNDSAELQDMAGETAGRGAAEAEAAPFAATNRALRVALRPIVAFLYQRFPAATSHLAELIRQHDAVSAAYRAISTAIARLCLAQDHCATSACLSPSTSISFSSPLLPPSPIPRALIF